MAISRNTVLLIIGGVVIIFGAFLLKKTSSPSVVSNDKLQVTTSFYPLAFFAQQIGGQYAHVTNITPAGAEPHEYEPTATDMATIQQSSILILNGAHLEAWGDRVKKDLPPTVALVTASDGLATQDVVEDGSRVIDPHVWLSPVLAAQMVDTIEAAYEKADPAHSVKYRENAATLKTQLNELDVRYHTELSTCATKDIITSHAAFGYLAAAYGLTQVPIAGLSPDAEPSPTSLAEIASFAKKHNVHYIFFESLVSPKLADTIAQEIGAKTLVLDPIEGLSDAQLAAGDTYLTHMTTNLTNLTIALQCTP